MQVRSCPVGASHKGTVRLSKPGGHCVGQKSGDIYFSREPVAASSVDHDSFRIKLTHEQLCESAAGVCCAAFQNAAQIGRSPLYASSSIRSVFGSRLNR